MSKPPAKKDYASLITSIGSLLELGRRQAYQTVNTILVRTYWEIGRRIIEYEQGGKVRAKYGDELICQLAKDLSAKYGRGFSRSNLTYMRLFYIKHKNSETLSRKLGWSHYSLILRLKDDKTRKFYLTETEKRA